MKTHICCKLGRLEIDLNPKSWDGYVDQTPELNDVSDEENVLVPWDDRLTSFQKLCVIKSFKEEKVNYCQLLSLVFHIILGGIIGCVCNH